MNDNRTNNRCV